MDVRDGFIVGVHNYCDRWCERCSFTSHCRVFAAECEADASLDPNMGAIVEAQPRESRRFPAPFWIEDDEPPPLPGVPPERQAIAARALGYAMRLHEWLTVRAAVESWKASEECQVLGRSGVLIATKVHRALTIWLDDDSNEPPGQADQDGSAKVALIAIDRSHDAWITLVARGEVSQAEAEPFVGDLLWLRAALEHVRPHARRFVRPAFDEPDAVAKLFAELSD